MTGSSGSVAALAFLAVSAVAGAAQTTPPLEGHWQCMDIVTNGGTTDYYEFDFGSTGALTVAFKSSGAVYTGRGAWTTDTADETLIHLTSHGEICNQYGFRCHDRDFPINFAFTLTSSSAVDFRTNGVVVRCQAANGQIDVDNWQPSTTQKALSILNMFGKGLEAAGNAGMRYEQMRNGQVPSADGGNSADASPEAAESAYNEQDAAAARHSELAKKRRINFLRWFIADHERSLARQQRWFDQEMAQTKPPIGMGSRKRNLLDLQEIIDKSKRELAQLESETP